MDVIVVEDSRIARHGLIAMLARYEVINVVAQAENAEQAVELINQWQPELIFLDIHLPGATGFDVLNLLEYSPKIIFTTAYTDYAIRSFDYYTVDYLVKPITHERLAKAVTKLSQEMTSQQVSTIQPPRLKMSNKLFFKTQTRCDLVTLEQVHYFESCKNYVRIFYPQGDSFIKKPLSKIAERLPDEYFFRVNRQYIVNLNAIEAITESTMDFDGYELKMQNGKVIPISKRCTSSLKACLSL